MDKHIYSIGPEEMSTYISDLGEKAYRVNQIQQGLYKEYYTDWSNFTTLPKTIVDKLQTDYFIRSLKPVRTIQSNDGNTHKTVFRLKDGYLIESVLMYYSKRKSICISTQAGCPIGCTFCATGQMGYHRNLTTGEIVEQVIYYANHLDSIGDRLSNIIVMGMGEPMLNYDSMIAALNIVNHPRCIGLGARKITISTVGIVPGIYKLAEESKQYNLAVSLHSVDNEKREKMIPIAHKYTVDDLLSACRTYIEKTHRRVTFEWAMIDGVNDSPSDAEALVRHVQGMICHVNLIPLNPTDVFGSTSSTRENIAKFENILISNGIPTSVRLRRGIDIQAGCGQLAAKHLP